MFSKIQLLVLINLFFCWSNAEVNPGVPDPISPALLINHITLDSSPPGGRVVRKEYRRLSDEERNRFHSALNQLKADKINGFSKYDMLAIVYNLPKNAPASLTGPAFLGWRREHGRLMELGLRQYDNTVAMPYWDPSLDEGLPDPRDSIMWTELFMGNGNGSVTTGPFAHWKPMIDPVNRPHNTTHIVRNIGLPNGRLTSDADLEIIAQFTKHADFVPCNNPFFGLAHNLVHQWFGGDMLTVPTALNDPIDPPAHAFLDYLWERFRQQKQTKAERESDYPPSVGNCTDPHDFPNAPMLPFTLKNIDGISSNYTDFFYTYQDRPTCSSTGNPLIGQCGSPYLVCDHKRWRCLSKIRLDGNCTGFEKAAEEICHMGICVKGKCKPPV